MKLELIFCPFQMFLCKMFKVSMFSWICLFAIFRAFAFISLVAGTSTELMEPALLAPPSGGIDGRRGQSQRNEQGKNLFPLVIFIAALSGSSVDDGFDILASFWAESVRKIKPQDFQQERDAWTNFFASAARRVKKGRTALLKAPDAGQSATSTVSTIDDYVCWQYSECYEFSPKIHLERTCLKGSQLQQVQKISADISRLLIGKPCVKIAGGGNHVPIPAEEVFPRLWSHSPGALLLKVPQDHLFSKGLVTPISYCKMLHIQVTEPEESEQASASSMQAAKFSSRDEYYQRGPNWGDPRQKRTAVQEILYGQLSFLLPNSDHAKVVLDLCIRILHGSNAELEIPPVPSKMMMRHILIKLDLCLMLSRRVFHSPKVLAASYFVSRNLSSDASPQAKHSFFCTIEEVLLQDSDCCSVLTCDVCMVLSCMIFFRFVFPWLKGREASLWKHSNVFIHNQPWCL